MANTYTSLHYHIVFSTRNREPFLTREIRDQLFPYLGGIARQDDMTLIGVGGMADHVHCLVMIPATVSLSKAVQILKGVSSKWIHSQFPALAKFSWQDGYAAFTVSLSNIPEVLKYIERQEEHHRKKSFQEEYVAFLKAHDIPYDERYVLG
jgi:REP element-mobilizing transposase RayT